MIRIQKKQRDLQKNVKNFIEFIHGEKQARGIANVFPIIGKDERRTTTKTNDRNYG